LTFEKVEEIKKQLQVKKQELDELSRTTIEFMWDRDLQAVSVALDEVDVIEAEDAAAAAGATEGRRQKEAKKGMKRSRIQTAAPSAPVLRQNPWGNEANKKRIEDMLKKPLLPGVASRLKTEAFATHSWPSSSGLSVNLQRSTTGESLRAAVSSSTVEVSAIEIQTEAPAKRQRKPATVGVPVVSVPAMFQTASVAPPPRVAPAPPPQDETGAGLLARLLGKGPAATPSLPSGPKELNSSEDLFSYLAPSRPQSVAVDVAPQPSMFARTTPAINLSASSCASSSLATAPTLSERPAPVATGQTGAAPRAGRGRQAGPASKSRGTGNGGIDQQGLSAAFEVGRKRSAAEVGGLGGDTTSAISLEVEPISDDDRPLSVPVVTSRPPLSTLGQGGSSLADLLGAARSRSAAASEGRASGGHDIEGSSLYRSLSSIGQRKPEGFSNAPMLPANAPASATPAWMTVPSNSAPPGAAPAAKKSRRRKQRILTDDDDEDYSDFLPAA